jgi:hypothetical protein
MLGEEVISRYKLPSQLRKLEQFAEQLREAGTPPFEAIVEMLRAVGFVGKP